MDSPLPKNGRSENGSYITTTACARAPRDEEIRGEKKTDWFSWRRQEGKQHKLRMNIFSNRIHSLVNYKNLKTVHDLTNRFLACVPTITKLWLGVNQSLISSARRLIDSILPCVCSVIDHRWRQDVVKTKNLCNFKHFSSPKRYFSSLLLLFSFILLVKGFFETFFNVFTF